MNTTLLATESDISLVPIEALEAIVRDHLADQSAIITAVTNEPLLQEGTNDSTRFFRATVSWEGARSGTATWIVKHWRAGGQRDGRMGIEQSREVLAWERGWLRPHRLPYGMVVPFVGAYRSPDGSEAWLAMFDVWRALSVYTRMSLPNQHAISRTRTILARLAQFHALWEQPEHQAELHASSWLGHSEAHLNGMSATYAQALGRDPAPHVPRHAYNPPPWDDLRAELDAFLQAQPAAERQLWEDAMIDRSAIMEGLADYPQTLLHNDLDDRNIGLRRANGHSLTDRDALVLIDWEWIARGAAAIDVASLIQRLPVMVMPGLPIDAEIWSDALADFYFARYKDAGGRCRDANDWRRSFGLAMIAQGVAQMPFLHGSLRRSIRGEIPLPHILGIPEEVIRKNLRSSLPMMEQMEQRVVREMHKWIA